MKKKITILASTLLIALLAFTLVACSYKTDTEGRYYTIKQLDLTANASNVDAKYNSLYERHVVDDGSDYMAHPDSVLVRRGGSEIPNHILSVYPKGHGKGQVLTKESADAGVTWSARRTDTPKSWEDSRETPTIYRLQFNDGMERLVMISAKPSWGGAHGDGFNASYSNDEGVTWTEFQKFHGWKEDGYVDPVVAMASLTRLKDSDGNWTDSWMGLFHNYKFVNFKSILTFEGENRDIMKWSTPEKYFAQYREIEKNSNMCEVEVIRSENGTGNELCLISRSNRKANNSLISFSTDEGKTWSAPKEVASALSGERHKADYLLDGRLVITFRSIERDAAKVKALPNNLKKDNWYSEGWVAWVGTYEDLKGMYAGDGSEGAYRIKVAHTYLNGQKEPMLSANADTGYCGNVVMPDGTYVTSSYGRFSSNNNKTYIVSKKINFTLVDELIAKM